MKFQITTLKGPRTRLILVGGVSRSLIPTMSLFMQARHGILEIKQKQVFIHRPFVLQTYDCVFKGYNNV